jgi:hypothetical protein
MVATTTMAATSMMTTTIEPITTTLPRNKERATENESGAYVA